MEKGYIQSIETMGLVDGPGIRVVIFLQGCDLRCLFCHNPETWAKKGSHEMTVEELVSFVLRYKNYFGEEGGITFSGGEPLIQSPFLLACLKKCREYHIHTCIDTAGYGDSKYWNDILDNTDLVLFDVKALDSESYQKITGKAIDTSLAFLKLCQEKKKPMWLRQVIIPGINDNEDYILALKDWVAKLKNIEKVEFLPYHTMGIEKYEKMQIPYRLKDTLPMDRVRCDELYQLFLKKTS